MTPVITPETHAKLRARFAELVMERVTAPRSRYSRPDIIVQNIEDGGVAAEDFVGLFGKAMMDVGVNWHEMTDDEVAVFAEPYVQMPAPFLGVRT